jgi:DNA-binding CsgD family transcriptional regulator
MITETLDNALINKAHMYRWIKDINGKFILCNDEMAQDVGFYKGEQLIGLTDFDLCWTDMAKQYKRNDDEVIIKQYPKTYCETVSCVQKKLYQCYSYKSPLIGKTKKIIGTIGNALLVPLQDLKNHSLSNTSFEYGLSKRQLECLLYLVKGMTSKEIANVLNLSFRTVQCYLEILKDKLNCISRSELIRKALTIDSIKIKLFL